MKQPDISVLIPLYNKKDFILSCLESCVKSQIKNLEIIVYDDASSDGSFDSIKDYKHQDSRVHIIRGKENIGSVEARKKLCAHARGKYIYFLDADDRLLPNSLQYALMIAKQDKAQIVKGWASTFNGTKTVFRDTETRHKKITRKTQFSQEPDLWYHFGTLGQYLFKASLIKPIFKDLPKIGFMGDDTVINSIILSKDQTISLVTIPIFEINRTYVSGSAQSSDLKLYEDLTSNIQMTNYNLQTFPKIWQFFMQAQMRRRVYEVIRLAKSFSYQECKSVLQKYKEIHSGIDITLYKPGNHLICLHPDNRLDTNVLDLAILFRFGSTTDIYNYVHDERASSPRTIINRIKQSWSHLTSISYELSRFEDNTKDEMLLHYAKIFANPMDKAPICRNVTAENICA